MVVNMELQFDKDCKVGRSPKTVLPPIQSHTKGEKSKSRREKLLSRNDNEYDLLSSEEGFTEINFCKYQSVSCKNLPSGDLEIECNEVSRRGSVYQSEQERKFKRSEIGSGRKKIEFSLNSETSFSFGILDSICGSDEENEAHSMKQHTSPIVSLKSRSVDLRDRQNGGAKSPERVLMLSRKFQCDQVSGPCTDANVLKDESIHVLSKSLSAKLSLPHSPTHSEGDSSKGSPISRFTPIKKMFDPLTKSKSHRNQLYDTKASGLAGFERNKMLRKSLLHDFSSVVSHTESASQHVHKEQHRATSPGSPAHLNGILSMEQKHGSPYFEFSVSHSEDVFVAKTWKAEDALNWVYTFHSFQGRKRNNANGWGMKCRNNDSPIVAQMQVSCYLSSEISGGGGGDFSNSMVTEFVLYDISHARKSVTPEEINCPEISKAASDTNTGSSKGNVELDDLFDLTKPRPTPSVDQDSANISTPYPWSAADLHPSLEIAAIVVQSPFEKRESLKHKRGDKISRHLRSGRSDLSSAGQGTRSVRNDNSSVKVNVVTPLGHHGLPSSVESRGPSPLLDRWRLGGGCDCGGWDMACPLVVFGNPDTNKCVKEHSLLENDQPLKLYRQGGKPNMPAVTITIGDKGQYGVDFHAQLSTLQAFAVCVAILHTTDASSSMERERSKQLLQCSSVKVLVDDEVKLLIEAVTEEEKRQVTKTRDENPTPFVFKPPISPIARV